MKEIAFVFLFFSFSALSLFGQTEHTSAEPTSEEVPNTLSQQAEPTSEEVPNTLSQQAEPTSEAVPHTPSQQTEVPSETAAESKVQWEKTLRLFKVVNDYELAADVVLTSLVMIAGNARLEGRVTGNVLVVGGDVELASGAQVNGTLHLLGGNVTGNIENVGTLQVSHRWQMIPAAVKLVMHPWNFWDIREGLDIRLMIVKFVLFLLMYLSVVTIFPRPIHAVSDMLTDRPVGSILFSTLMLGVIPLIFALLTLSIIGVPLMLLGVSVLLPLAICGKAAIFLTLGGTLFSDRLKPLAAIFGYILYFMATAMPYIDWVTFLVVNTIGIGVCLLSGINMMRLQSRRRNTPLLPGNEWTQRAERM